MAATRVADRVDPPPSKKLSEKSHGYKNARPHRALAVQARARTTRAVASRGRGAGHITTAVRLALRRHDHIGGGWTVVMDETTEDLLSGGYCFSIRDSGPFVVGEDFEAPGPAARVLPNLPTDRQTWDKLWAHIPAENTAGSDELSDQNLFNDAVRQSEFENGVSEALRWYVSDAAFQADAPKVRKELSKLKRIIERYNEQLPGETTTLGHFLSKTYAGTCFLRSERQPTERQLIALQEHWRDRVGLLALRDTLCTVLRNVEAAQVLLGRSKTVRHRERTFVRSLAHVWKNAVGRWPKSSRDPIENHQAGAFADFVRATASVLPHDFRIGSLDRAIRAACERPE